MTRTTKNILLGLLSGLMAGLVVFILIRLRNQEREREITWLAWEDVEWIEPVGRVEEDDLEAIRGIGPAYARRLKAAGIVTYLALASQTPAQLEKILGPRVRTSDLESWILQAKILSS